MKKTYACECDPTVSILKKLLNVQYIAHVLYYYYNIVRVTVIVIVMVNV